MDSQHIVIFDGVCNLCNGAVNFIIKRDAAEVFVFTPMQTDFAQSLLREHGVAYDGVDTFALIKNGQCLTFSSAALEITKDLSGFWYLFNVFRLLPKTVRDFFYKLFARSRYAFFGRSETCIVPDDEIKSRFIGI